jgi:hypothetical protein
MSSKTTPQPLGHLVGIHHELSVEHILIITIRASRQVHGWCCNGTIYASKDKDNHYMAILHVGAEFTLFM